ncbi:hypothetical protein PPL_05437 [Heterostelium album PN500]|uniref:F-box domain-containing protein n=1 Tax=Heterostelium pallidum (strain ATCC 26659 / Pp 5 / PN500) TaxID=670386 RepID=D3BA62_HETP5|nr:hypothetical protein PPL_05437 [Heterostelium album PN500]EFA81449.1 hypothetical protein PPL_05437 [Heterostelium album PN500]|eukprot:XP_020433567.1 hypothetical protein PPL_05437 [Heterostelium album PN500]
MKISISKIFRTSSSDKISKRRSSSSSLTSSDEDSPLYIFDPNSTNISHLPYDIVQKILSYVHDNVILTHTFINVSLVCKNWRTLCRISGHVLNVNNFFQRTLQLKMKSDVTENSPDDAKTLNNYLRDNNTLTELNLNLSGCSSLDSVKNLMESNTKLKSLNIRNMSNTTSDFSFVSSEFINHLINALINNKNQAITHLNLSGLKLDDSSMTLLGTFVGQSGSKLARLEISDCPNTFNAVPFLEFGKGIELNKTLSSLILNRNKVSHTDSYQELITLFESKEFHNLETQGTFTFHTFSSPQPSPRSPRSPLPNRKDSGNQKSLNCLSNCNSIIEISNCDNRLIV